MPQIIFTPHHLQILGLEHTPSPPSQVSPYPYARDPVLNEAVFFNPLGCMISFRMLERALARLQISTEIDEIGAGTPHWHICMQNHARPCESHADEVDLIAAYVSAAFALASP